MEKIFIIRQKLKQFYTENDIYIRPVLKFLIMMLILRTAAANLGFDPRLCRWDVDLITALLCSMLPWSAMTFISALFMIGHFLALSWEVALLGALVWFLLAIAQYLFLPGFSICIVLIPVAYYYHIPYLIPLLLGMVGGATACVPAAAGTFTYYFLTAIQKNAGVLTENTVLDIDTIQRFGQVLAAIGENQLMLLSMAAFGLTAAAVYIIRRLSVDYAPYIAISVGALLNIAVYLTGGMLLEISVPYAEVLIGTLVSLVIALLATFWVIAVDYRRSEYLQYEDDDYVYFVKAVPKIRLAEEDVHISEINAKVEEAVEEADIREALKMLDSIEAEEKSE